MNSLHKKILSLPKEIEDQMKLVCEEIETVVCDNGCGSFISKKRAFKNTMMWDDYYYCSEYCLHDHEYYFRKELKIDMKNHAEKYINVQK